MHAMQPSRRCARRHTASRKAERRELAGRYDTVLPRRELRDRAIDRALDDFVFCR
jgi:hypothetical protein